MASMRAIQVPSAGADFEMVERDVPSPGFGEALVRVHACGVCHSDVFAKEGGYPGVSHPLVPGHEIAGAVEALGEGVHGWEVGQRVGVGWFGGNCGYCEWCRRGSLIDCENMEIPGVTIDGGYADHVVVRSSALASMPDDLADEDAAPCFAPASRPTTRCATAAHGAATGWRSSGSAASDTSASSSRSSSALRQWAIARGAEKRKLALDLGAHHYIDSTAGDPGEALAALGGADVILSR
jgi:D-arabinose 1-dehydrogenase-like Zn-dependent alcohol dehydrogenase